MSTAAEATTAAEAAATTATATAEAAASKATTAATETAGPAAAAAGRTGYDLGLRGQKPLTLGALARELARAADCFRFLAGALLGGLFVVAAQLHLAENPLALHFLLERLEGLIDVVVANENLHVSSSFQV
jgi:hypothetical protein